METRHEHNLCEAEKLAVAAFIGVGFVLLMLSVLFFVLQPIYVLGFFCIPTTLVYLLVGVCIAGQKSWAVILGLILSCIQSIICWALCAMLFAYFPPIGLAFVVIVMFSIWINFQLIRCLTIKRVDPRRGFEMVVARPISVETMAMPQEISDGTAPTPT